MKQGIVWSSRRLEAEVLLGQRKSNAWFGAASVVLGIHVALVGHLHNLPFVNYTKNARRTYIDLPQSGNQLIACTVWKLDDFLMGKEELTHATSLVPVVHIS
jgi:hypothetical protein